MIALRCTQKIVHRLGKVEVNPSPAPPTNALGDWYINLLRCGRLQVVMATSERSLLTVLLPAQGLRTTLAPNLCAMTQMLLEEIGVASDRAAREVEAMQPATFARTASRSVLASMNEFAAAVDWGLHDERPPMEIMLRLADTLKSGLGEGTRSFGQPAVVTRELLAAPPLRERH